MAKYYHNNDLHELVYPKWAKIRFIISPTGQLIFIMNPSFTPGKLPEGIKGQVPKGTKIINYDREKEGLVSLSLSECIKIVDFFKRQNLADTVELTHVLRGDKKYLKLSWGTSNNSSNIGFCHINYTKRDAENNEVAKIYCPLPLDGLREMGAILNSYINNYTVITLMCRSKSDNYQDTKSADDSFAHIKSSNELPDDE